MEGGCHCGAIRFRTEGAPYWIGACYCVDCRKISGAPYLAFAGFREGEYELLQGIPKEYASSDAVVRSFCENCSSPISFTYISRPNEPFVPAGIFDDPSALAPKKHIFVSQKLPWVTITDDFPQEQ